MYQITEYDEKTSLYNVNKTITLNFNDRKNIQLCFKTDCYLNQHCIKMNKILQYRKQMLYFAVKLLARITIPNTVRPPSP